MTNENKRQKTLRKIRKAKGIIRMSEALELGIHRRDLYTLRDAGDLEVLDRGLFCLRETKSSIPDFIPVAKKIPEGVICLISALAFHGITTQIPHYVYVALPRSGYKPKISHPPMRYFWFSEKMLQTGVEEQTIDGCKFKIFNVEKTLIDCMKFRNKIGMDIAIEALKIYWQRGETNINRLMKYAKLFRVEKALTPILETIIS